MPEKLSSYKLGYNCPVDFKAMPKCNGGFACSQCDKKVFDYSKMNYPDFLEARNRNEEESTCGIYKSHQLEGVFGDWRDKVTAAYRRSLMRAHRKRALVVFVPLFAAALFLSGCASHYCGMTYDNYGKDTNSKETLKEKKEARQKKKRDKKANSGVDDIAIPKKTDTPNS